MNQIKKIVFDIDGKEYEFSLEQAKIMKEILDGIFKEKEYVSLPVPVYVEPYRYIPPTYPYIYPTITWNDSGGTHYINCSTQT